MWYSYFLHLDLMNILSNLLLTGRKSEKTPSLSFMVQGSVMVCKKNTQGKQLKKQKILRIVRGFKKSGYVQWLLWGIVPINLTLSLIKKGRHLNTLSWSLLCFIKNAHIIKTLWMFVQFVEWNFTAFSFMKMHLCSVKWIYSKLIN